MKEFQMSLYFVRHQHSAETCPAKNPEMGQMLVQHVGRTNARKFGVDILGDAVIDGQHTFVLIVEAEDKGYIENFMQPFAQAGSVEIQPASTCEAVVERLGCDPVPAGRL
jgi:uncharacterized protein with GYD domain